MALSEQDIQVMGAMFDEKLDTKLGRFKKEVVEQFRMELDVLKVEMNSRFVKSDKKIDEKFQESDKKIDERFQESGKKIDERFQESGKKIDERFRESDKRNEELFQESERRNKSRYSRVRKHLVRQDEKIEELRSDIVAVNQDVIQNRVETRALREVVVKHQQILSYR